MSKGKIVITLLSSLSNEKNISMESLIQILEDSISIAVRKEIAFSNFSLQVRFDREEGEFKLIHIWDIVEDSLSILDTTRQMSLQDARGRFSSDVKVGIYEERIDYNLSRIAVSQIKQATSRIINTQVSQRVLDDLSTMSIPMVRGIVKHILPNKILCKLINYELECFIPNSQLLKNDRYHKGDTIECHVMNSYIGPNGDLNLSLSRCSTGMLEGLIVNTVPEIEDKKVEIHQIVRLPSVRSKVVVSALEHGIDPVGALIGYRGERINDISKKLSGERIDVILYDQDILKFIRNAYKGLDLIDIVEQSDSSILVIVPSNQLPIFIGKAGSNVNLTSQLIRRPMKIITQTQSGE